MKNIETSYMGLKLKSPIILGACDLSSNNDKLKRAVDHGVGAIVYKSIFEEQVQVESFLHDERISQYNDIHAEMATLHPSLEVSDIEYFLVKLRRTKESIPVPLIASLNCVNESSWFKYAKLIEETGVDAIELNLYQIPVNFDIDASYIEQRQLEIVRGIKEILTIPVSVKLSSEYTNLLHFAKRLDMTGVDGMVLFNAFFQPDVDIRKEIHKSEFNITNKGEYKKSLRFTGMLYGRIKTDICSSRGVESAEDIIKLLLSGASCVQMVSAIYRRGIDRISDINREISEWMDKKGYENINQFRGKLSDNALNRNDNLLVYKRAQYIDLLLHADTIMDELKW